MDEARIKTASLTSREATLMEAILEAVAGELKRRDQRFAELETKLATVERQKGVTLAEAFQGPWLANKLYQAGHLVQCNRRTWLALVETRERPGPSSDWRELEFGQERAR